MKRIRRLTRNKHWSPEKDSRPLSDSLCQSALALFPEPLEHRKSHNARNEETSSTPLVVSTIENHRKKLLLFPGEKCRQGTVARSLPAAAGSREALRPVFRDESGGSLSGKVQGCQGKNAGRAHEHGTLGAKESELRHRPGQGIELAAHAQARQAHKALKVRRDLQVLKVLQVRREQLVQKALPVRLALQARRDHKVRQAHRVFKAKQVQPVQPVLKALKVRQEQRVRKDQRVLQVQQALKVRQEQRVRRDQPVLLALQVRRDLQVR